MKAQKKGRGRFCQFQTTSLLPFIVAAFFRWENNYIREAVDVLSNQHDLIDEEHNTFILSSHLKKFFLLIINRYGRLTNEVNKVKNFLNKKLLII